MPGSGESGRNGSIAVAQALQHCVFSLPVTIHAKRAERGLERVASLSGTPVTFTRPNFARRPRVM
jgi:hypothetical protein